VGCVSDAPITSEAGMDAAMDGGVGMSDAGLDSPSTDSGVDSAVFQGAKSISCGARYIGTGAYGGHCCALTTNDGAIYCWGANEHGQIGNGKNGNGTAGEDVTQATHVDVDGNGSKVLAFDQIAVGAWHSCARKGGSVSCWGQRETGAVGDGSRNYLMTTQSDATRPLPITGLAATL